MRIVFAGTSAFACPALKRLYDSDHEVCAVYTQPDRLAGRGLKLTASPVKQLALQLCLPVYQPENLKSEAVQQEMIKQAAEIMIDVAYGQFIPPQVLDIFPFGCVNIHPSLLPRWRGAAPIQRAILAGDAKTGVTIMQVDEGWDTGDILSQITVPISREDTAANLEEKLAQIGANLLIEVLEDLKQQNIIPVKQDEKLSSYAAKIEKAEAQIDWQCGADEISRKVRAFNPQPVAFCILHGQRIKIWKAEYVKGQIKENTKPGEIVTANENGIDVITGNGILRILELQLPGGRVLTAREMLNSKRTMFAVGNRFDA